MQFHSIQVLKICSSTFVIHHHLPLKTESKKNRKEEEDPSPFSLTFSGTQVGRNRIALMCPINGIESGSKVLAVVAIKETIVLCHS